MGQTGLVLFLFAFALLFALCLGALAFVPAYILWKRTHDKRYPMMWVTCSAIVVVVASVQTFLLGGLPAHPAAIDEPLSIADKSGSLRVTALRMPAPEQPLVRIAVDAENTGDEKQLLGIQCTTSSGQTDASAPKLTTTHHIWTVEPKWKGTLECEAQLPGIFHDGEVTVVLAKCNSTTPGADGWLPTDSEALYQERFNLLPPR